MPFVPVPNTAKAVFHQRLDGEDIVNVMNFTSPGGWDTASLGELGNALGLWTDAQLYANLSQDIELVDIRCTDLSVEPGAFNIYVPPEPIRGAIGDGSLPNNVAVFVESTTGLSGRGYHGGTFIAGIAADDVADSSLTAARADAFKSAFDALALAVTALGYSHVLVHRIVGGVPLTTGTTSPITGYSCNRTVDSQRTRLPGKRRHRHTT